MSLGLEYSGCQAFLHLGIRYEVKMEWYPRIYWKTLGWENKICIPPPPSELFNMIVNHTSLLTLGRNPWENIMENALKSMRL